MDQQQEQEQQPNKIHSNYAQMISPTAQKKRRLRHSNVVPTTVSMLLLGLYSPITVSGFMLNQDNKFVQRFTPSTATVTSGTELRFRSYQPSAGFTTDTSSALLTDTLWQHCEPISASFAEQSLSPPWLSLPKDHLVESNLRALQVAMRSSFFTENESLRLQKAIEVAAAGDRQLKSGAAEFCLLLVETMEMGLTALVAAVFHYCSSVRLRLAGDEPSIRVPDGLEHFGKHCAAIAADATRLKQLEGVAAMVMENSYMRSSDGPDRFDADNLRKMFLSETKDWRALAIRSAACLYRLRGILHQKNGVKELYTAPAKLTQEAVTAAREALHIFAPLASRLGMHRLKNELEGAAFRVLYRRQYKRVIGLMNEHRTFSDSIGASMSDILVRVKADVISMLENDPEFKEHVEKFSVNARVKEPYSMWKKMLTHGYRHILQVPDAMALRIVLDAKKLSESEPAEVTRARERVLCYYAQRLCTDQWKPHSSQPRFKDYIERPKSNGYQSLHYTACAEHCGEDWNLEIQVRSGEMHHVAEYGLASHWDYKAQESENRNRDWSPGVTDDDESVGDQSSDAYMRNLQEWHWQHHGDDESGTLRQPWDATPATFEPVVRSDIWQSRERSDRIRDRKQRLQPYLEALTDARLELSHRFVFVFYAVSDGPTTTHGKVMALPAGACVWDALQQAQSTVNDVPLFDEWLPSLNGATTSITQRLRNGDVLTLQRENAHRSVLLSHVRETMAVF